MFDVMMDARVWLTVAGLGLLAGCAGSTDDAQSSEDHAHDAPAQSSDAEHADPSAAPADTAQSEPALPEPEPVAMPVVDAGARPIDNAPAGAQAPAPTTSPDKGKEPKPLQPSKPQDKTPTIGSGELTQPANGPAPLEAAKLSGMPYTLVKNWDFGTKGTIRNQSDLDAEFQFHDQFGTIANGTNYGAVTVSPSLQDAIGASGLGLPHNQQPVEDPANPNREFTADSLLTHVRPLALKLKKVSVKKHNAGNGSFTSKWKLATGGALLGHDLVWETRLRMPKQVPGYWLALWTAGTLWDKGAEMDVLESFGTPNINADAFHSDAVGGTGTVDYTTWPSGLTSAGVPTSDRQLSDWHVWTWVYLRDDSFEVYYDGYRVQKGSIHWTVGGAQGTLPIDMRFLFDFSWGHMQISDVNIELPAAMFPLTYEIDYSRVYMR
jgi:hypothetical protein